jgi:hypothetical protein
VPADRPIVGATSSPTDDVQDQGQWKGVPTALGPRLDGAWAERHVRRGRQMTDGRDSAGWAVGFTLFAAIMMIMVGAWQALAGLVAIFENEFYVATRSYLYELDATTWGGSIWWSA